MKKAFFVFVMVAFSGCASMPEEANVKIVTFKSFAYIILKKIPANRRYAGGTLYCQPYEEVTLLYDNSMLSGISKSKEGPFGDAVPCKCSVFVKSNISGQKAYPGEDESIYENCILMVKNGKIIVFRETAIDKLNEEQKREVKKFLEKE